jgi:AcrR family transcriptional regulator
MFTYMGRANSDVRERILAAAVQRLREEGLRGLSQPRVAKAASVPQGQLTYYFPRRVDLMAAVARRTLEEALADMQRFLGGDSWRSVRGDERKRISAIAAHLIDNRERTRMLVGLLVEADQDEALAVQIRQGAAMVRGVLAGVFDRSPGDPDVDLLIAALWGLGLQALVLEGERTPAQTAALVSRLPKLFDTLAHPKPRPPARGRRSPRKD